VVLIIEDNEKNLKLVRDILQYHGFRTLEATAAASGIQLAVEEVPDVILMDIELPDMNGIVALERLRAEPITATIPVVALTASATSFDRDRLVRANFAGVIIKPISLHAFPGQVLAYCNSAKKVHDES